MGKVKIKPKEIIQMLLVKQDELYKWFADGCTIREVADKFNVTPCYLNRVLSDTNDPDVLLVKNTIKAGQKDRLFEILKRCITGYNVTEVRTLRYKNKNGEDKVTTEAFERWIPPDTNAIFKLLRTVDDEFYDEDIIRRTESLAKIEKLNAETALLRKGESEDTEPTIIEMVDMGCDTMEELEEKLKQRRLKSGEVETDQ